MFIRGTYIIIITIHNYYHTFFYSNPRTRAQYNITQVQRYNMFQDLQRRIRIIAYLLFVRIT